MARGKRGFSNAVSATHFRAHLFEHLGSAAAGNPVSICYKGGEYQLLAVKPRGKLDKFYASGKPEPVIADPNDRLFSDDPALKRDREEKWVAKWNRRIRNK